MSSMMGQPVKCDAKDLSFLRRALTLAQKGDARVFPNPRVGAVVVKDDEVLGEGFHQKSGEAHAEVHAVAACDGQDLTGATVYVSLEPCAHHGRTPPCAQLLLDEGIGRVVYAVADPGPGEGGGAMLRSAGLDVVGPVELEGAQACVEPFVKNFLKREAYFLLKWAMTLDGRIALESGDSKWITSEQARQDVHRLRTVCDGIMVGAGTVLKDHPRLDVRHGVEGPTPRPIVWDPKGRLDSDSPCWDEWKGRHAIWITPNRGLEIDGVTKIDLQPEQFGSVLFEHGLHMIMVEGGAGLHGLMLDYQLGDAVAVYVAPKLCGGTGSLSPVGGVGVSSMNLAHACMSLSTRRLGEDMVFEGCLRQHAP